MAFDFSAMLRRGIVPFLAGATGTAALSRGFYATATVCLLVALWAVVLIGQAAARFVTPAPPSPVMVPTDQAEQRRLRSYLDLSPAPLVALGADDRIRVVNRAARRLFGVEELLLEPPAALAAAIRDTAPGRSATVRVNPGDGEHAFAVVTADMDGAGAAVRVAALVNIDADLRAAETATLQDMVTVLSHEITNTLTPIASLSATAATMLAEPVPDTVAVRAAVDIVSRRALALQRFGEAYRDLARLPVPAPRRFDLAAMAADLAQMFRARWPAVDLAVTGPTTLDVNGDPDQLAQAVWALLQNAAEMGTAVRLDLARVAVGASITVADDGEGVPAANVDTIFRPFFTTKPTGSGVGLALTRQIFRAHGGDVRLVQAKPSAIFSAEL